MGIDPIHVINHKLFYKEPKEFMAKLKQATNLDVFVSRISVVEKIEEVRAPEDFIGWVTHLEDNQTLEQRETRQTTDSGIIDFYLRDKPGNDISFLLNCDAMEIHGEPFYMGRWFEVESIVDYIKENGLPKSDDYLNNENLNYKFRNRKNLFDYVQQFGSAEMITYCWDKHQGFADDYYYKNWSFEELKEHGKKDFIYVEFQDLANFDFPQNQPEYYNVFIYDDFRDLK